MLSDFERLLKSCPADKRDAITSVSDTCYMGLLWSKAYGVNFTGADLLKFADMVLAEERRQDDAERDA